MIDFLCRWLCREKADSERLYDEPISRPKVADIPRKEVQIDVQDFEVMLICKSGEFERLFVADAIPSPHHAQGFILVDAEGKLMSFLEQWKNRGTALMRGIIVPFSEFQGGTVHKRNRVLKVNAYLSGREE